MAAIFLIPLFVLFWWFFYVLRKNYFLSVVRDIRPWRLVHFEAMFWVGIFLAKIFSPDKFSFELGKLPAAFLLMMALIFAWLFSVLTNNIADRDIDEVANKERPTVTSIIPPSRYKVLAALFFGAAVIYSTAVDFTSFFLMLVFVGNYFLYSMPPLRLKRVTFFSKSLIALNSLVALLLGYYLASRTFMVPGKITLFFMVFMTASLNFIDIKDYRGDKRAGIKTLPVVLGPKDAKLLISFFVAASYVFLPLIFPDPRLSFVAAVLGTGQVIFINRSFYREEPVFLIYFLTILSLFLCLSGGGFFAP
jgi:4-hydroxybenzoate polyprenyltransferase